MNIYLLIAGILTLAAFFIHTFMGDRELKILEPGKEVDQELLKREKWTMARCGWHWVSFDLLFAAIGLGVIQFTDFLESEQLLLRVLALYFLGYAIVWGGTILISPRFPANFLKLGQWMLLLILSGLVFLGAR